MTNIETIKNGIIDFRVEDDVIEVEFDNYILEVNLKDLEGQEINKDTLATVIYNKYQNRED